MERKRMTFREFMEKIEALGEVPPEAEVVIRPEWVPLEIVSVLMTPSKHRVVIS
jgi:hypothetical protein